MLSQIHVILSLRVALVNMIPAFPKIYSKNGLVMGLPLSLLLTATLLNAVLLVEHTRKLALREAYMLAFVGADSHTVDTICSSCKRKQDCHKTRPSFTDVHLWKSCSDDPRHRPRLSVAAAEFRTPRSSISQHMICASVMECCYLCAHAILQRCT